MKMIGIMEEMKMGETAKKAILAVSFGTSHSDTRKVTIDAIEEDLKAAFEDCSLYRAWTSKMILKKLKQRDGIHIDNVREAMEHMQRDGITDVTVQPTHVINGIENDLMKEDVLAFSDSFSRITFGVPLLTSEQDSREVVKVLTDAFGGIPKDEALVFMGHGTPHYANAIYAALDYTFKDLGYHNLFMGTVEAYPSMDSLLRLVGSLKPSRVHLAPFMIVAGDHANNDMAGDEDGSWKKEFEKAGYDVTCLVRGLGELEPIQQLFTEHAQAAIDSLK